MSSSGVKNKAPLFADLGRPTLRGIRKCPKCGTVNGTRGSSCKNKGCDVIFRGKEREKKMKNRNNNNQGNQSNNKDKDATSASQFDSSQLSSLPGFQEDVYYSVRCKESRGKDQRNFVRFKSPTDDKGRNYHCLVEACSKKAEAQYPCPHILAAQKCSTRSTVLQLRRNALPLVNVPSSYAERIKRDLEMSNVMVQRVSKVGFVVTLKGEGSTEGGEKEVEWEHCFFIRHPKPDMEWKFCCSCSGKKNREKNNVPDQFPNMCLHFYICVVTFASDPALKNEFEMVIPQSSRANEVSSPFLSQVQLVSSDGKPVEFDSTFSVEIMRDNLSLLEMSIPSGEESSLANVQTFEGVLSDPIIVANVDDALSFGDGTALDSLDEDQQMFSHSHHGSVSSAYSSSSSERPNTRSQENENRGGNLKSVSISTPTPPKKRKECKVQDSGTNNVNQVPSKSSASITSTIIVKTHLPTKSPSRQSLPPNRNSGVEDPRWAFDLWLGGVNERINTTMNYQLPANPEPLVYYIPAVYFDILKERLTACAPTVGSQKKRLPNHTSVIQRSDKPPIGSFTKYVWKITSILHVLKVFECSTVRLKPKQYFIQSSGGNFVEWVPPPNNEGGDAEGSQKPRILPVLHSTVLKCGRSYPSATKEVVPLIIEWIPDILRVSKLGELSIHFQFYKGDPIQSSGRDVSVKA